MASRTRRPHRRAARKATRKIKTQLAQYKHSDERKFRSLSTRLANQVRIQEDINVMFFSFYRGHKYFKRLFQTDRYYPLLVREFLKDLAIHYWQNFPNPTQTSSKMMISHVENMLVIGVLNTDRNRFMNEEVALTKR